MTVKVSGIIDEEVMEDIQDALEPLLVENGVDNNIMELTTVDIDSWREVEVRLDRRSK